MIRGPGCAGAAGGRCGPGRRRWRCSAHRGAAPASDAGSAPDAALDRTVWNELFAAAGFTADGCPVPRPDRPVALWRGSVPERRADWSWTIRRFVAEGYATGTGARRPRTGHLYPTVAPPTALLTYNSNRGEDEYVLDTTGLTITEVPLTGA